MVLWEIFAIAGLAFLILEMIVPSMFFLNLALAGFVTAMVALFVKGWIILTFIFVVLSILSILLLRPILIKQKESKEKETGMEARTDSDETIPVGSEVRIVKNESLVLTVEKI